MFRIVKRQKSKVKKSKNKKMKVQLDMNTLPSDGEKIKWQTHKEASTDLWHEGTYSDEGLFVKGFENTSDGWNIAFDVIEWFSI